MAARGGAARTDGKSAGRHVRPRKKIKVLTIVLVVFQVLGLVSSVHAVLGTRTAQGAIAWVVSLNAAPIIAVPAYWVFGRSKFHGYVNAWRDESLDIDEELDRVRESVRPLVAEVPSSFPAYGRPRGQARFLSGNEVELLVDGPAVYDSIAEGIAGATDYVLFQFYILRKDDSGNRFRDLLIDKAGEGVRVYVLYDELGSSELDAPWLADFQAAGIPIVPFNTRQGPNNRFQLNFRNHRKIVVVDGTSTWVGGLNIGDDYLGAEEKLSPWRDTHLRIRGPAALAAQMLFWSDWHWARRELIGDLSWTPVPADGSDAEVLVLGSGPADQLETASVFFTHLLNGASERVWIATPYFIPDQATLSALRLALLKGVEVRILTPRTNDNWFVRHAANVYLSELSQLGARIFFYEEGFMHQKVMLVDDGLALVGTVNFDNRSFRLNFEVTAAVAEQAFAGEVEAMLVEDFSRSSELVDYDLESASLWERIKARGSALLAPVL